MGPWSVGLILFVRSLIAMFNVCILDSSIRDYGLISGELIAYSFVS